MRILWETTSKASLKPRRQYPLIYPHLQAGLTLLPETDSACVSTAVAPDYPSALAEHLREGNSVIPNPALLCELVKILSSWAVTLVLHKTIYSVRGEESAL